MLGIQNIKRILHSVSHRETATVWNGNVISKATLSIRDTVQGVQ